jgi:hypothetical protein
MPIWDLPGVSGRVVQAVQTWRSSAPSLLAVLAPRRAAALEARAAARDRSRLLLRRVVESVVVPQCVAAHRVALLPSWASPPAHARTEELARLLIQVDPADAFDLLERLRAQAGNLAQWSAAVCEPAARRLGDLWATDDCTETDLILGLARLHSALHRPCCGCELAPASAGGRRTVLVAPQPGELHGLGAALDAELLWHAGWHVHCESPSTDAALQQLVGDTWFDAVDLSSSIAFRREHLLPRMARSIAAARAASRNPAVIVVASGRVFFEAEQAHGTVAASVGADAGIPTAARIGATLMQAMSGR